jgi:hypothetical protein
VLTEYERSTGDLSIISYLTMVHLIWTVPRPPRSRAILGSIVLVVANVPRSGLGLILSDGSFDLLRQWKSRFKEEASTYYTSVYLQPSKVDNASTMHTPASNFQLPQASKFDANSRNAFYAKSPGRNTSRDISKPMKAHKKKIRSIEANRPTTRRERPIRRRTTESTLQKKRPA